MQQSLNDNVKSFGKSLKNARCRAHDLTQKYNFEASHLYLYPLQYLQDSFKWLVGSFL